MIFAYTKCKMSFCLLKYIAYLHIGTAPLGTTFEDRMENVCVVFTQLWPSNSPSPFCPYPLDRIWSVHTETLFSERMAHCIKWWRPVTFGFSLSVSESQYIIRVCDHAIASLLRCLVASLLHFFSLSITSNWKSFVTICKTNGEKRWLYVCWCVDE